MSKAEVLDQVYPDEVGFLLESAEKFNARRRVELLALHRCQNPEEHRKELMAIIDPDKAKVGFSEGLARLAEIRWKQGKATAEEQDASRRIRLIDRAKRLSEENRG